MTLHDDLRRQLDAQLVERLGDHLGLTPAQAVAVADEVLPAQLQRLTQLASTASGAQRLLDLARHHVPMGRLDGLTGSRDGLSALQRSGTLLLPEVMGASLDADVQRTSTSTDVIEPSVRQMMTLLLPLLLGVIASRAQGRGLSAATLATLFGGAALASPGRLDAASTAEVAMPPGAPVSPSRLPAAKPVLVSQRLQPLALKDDRRRLVGWWWLLPLVLVGVGGCYELQQRPGVVPRVTQPVQNARVTVSENGRPVATTQVGAGGTFRVTVAEPDAGSHTYTVTQRGTPAVVERTVTVGGAAAPTQGATEAGNTPTLTFTAPASGAAVPATGLTLQGTGPADSDVTLSENGVSLGTVRIDAAGTWRFNVPSAVAGGHTYVATAGEATNTLALTVEAGATPGGPCTSAFTLSLNDGQTAAPPFRFGGQGSGTSYTVTVSRGERRVGQKTLRLDGACGWRYTPGLGKVTYTLRETGRTAVAGPGNPERQPLSPGRGGWGLMATPLVT